MMRLYSTRGRDLTCEGVSTLLEYVLISGVLMVLMVIMILTVNAVFMEGPADMLSSHAFTDIGNGISTRIVDIYVTAPENGTITTAFDIPDDVAGREYFVRVEGTGTDQQIVVTDGKMSSTVMLAGIGASRGVTGNTTGSGWNRITYNSLGV